MEEISTRINDSAQPVIHANWDDLMNQERCIHQLENQVLPAYLKRMRWFGGKARPVLAIKIYQVIPIETEGGLARYTLLKVRYPDGPTEIYALPMVFVPDTASGDSPFPADALVARIELNGKLGYIIDGIYDVNFRNALFMLMSKRQIQQGNHYPVLARAGKYLLNHGVPEVLQSQVLKADQSNSAIIFNNTYFLKLFRKVEYMINPDWEIVNFLTNQGTFNHIPAFAGSVELKHPEKEAMLLVMLQQLVPNQGDSWNYFISQIEQFFKHVVASGYHLRPLPIKPHTLQLDWDNTPEELRALIGHEVFERASLLGKRTAEMHLAMAGSQEPDFVPEPVDQQFQENLLKNLLRLVDTKFDLLERNIHRISGSLQTDAREMLQSRERVRQFFTNVLQRPMGGQRIRIHGDYHLGQVLVTDTDFCILDFEGEPDKLHTERRDKYPPLKDVAGMMRSFRYAAYAVLFHHYDTDPELRDKLMRVADVWYHYVSRYFLGEYIQTVQGSELLPSDEKMNDILQVYSFKKAIYELGYEINNRPDWAVIPLQSLVKFVKHYLDA
jgi:maltose alpha-D-glucosyltransferase/alpha-amylase